MADNNKSKILVIGGTGYAGKFIVQASVRSGHPTFALVRRTVATPANLDEEKLLEGFRISGVTVLEGDLNDYEGLVKAVKQVDVVISAVAEPFEIQTKIIAAIKEAGNIKRFLPSEFGMDFDRVDAVAVEPVKSYFAAKAKIRRAIEAEDIPHTFISSNLFAGIFVSSLGQLGVQGIPTERVDVYGDDDKKAIFLYEEDIANVTIRAVDDPRTLNKIVYLRPQDNIYSHSELISLWEKKSGRTLEKTYINEEEIMKKIQESPYPLNTYLGVRHVSFIKGVQTNFEIDPSKGVEATELYPDIKYTTVDEYLDRFL